MSVFMLLYLARKLVVGVVSNDLDRQLDATMNFRMLFSKQKNPPIGRLVERGVVPRSVELLRGNHFLLQVCPLTWSNPPVSKYFSSFP